jgi:hypothetical protein
MHHVLRRREHTLLDQDFHRDVEAEMVRAGRQQSRHQPVREVRCAAGAEPLVGLREFG